MNRREDGVFWPSYVDLMTSLFIVALVLFVVSYEALSAESNRLKVSADSYRRLQDIDAAIKGLDDGKTFIYQPEFKRYLLKRQVQFSVGSDTINPSDYDFLLQAGGALARLVERLRSDPSGRNVRYLVVIEGMASRDSYQNNYQLSYARALALYHFWDEHDVHFDPASCEVLIAGSGTGGIGRYTGANEFKNQRFLIQIIPKVAYQN